MQISLRDLRKHAQALAAEVDAAFEQPGDVVKLNFSVVALAAKAILEMVSPDAAQAKTTAPKAADTDKISEKDALVRQAIAASAADKKPAGFDVSSIWIRS